MSKTKHITYFGIAIALYVVLGMMVKIPLIGHIGTDLGYVVFGFCCYTFGWTALIIGVIGCIIESMLISGWIPIGWMLGQALIGAVCGLVYRRNYNKIVDILVTVFSVFVGIVVIKTAVECTLYSIPVAVKMPKSITAFVADTVPMLIGLFIGYKYKGRVVTK